MTLESLDRRLFLRGLMLTSAGLVIPKPAFSWLPWSCDTAYLQRLLDEGRFVDGEFTVTGTVYMGPQSTVGNLALKAVNFDGLLLQITGGKAKQVTTHRDGAWLATFTDLDCTDGVGHLNPISVGGLFKLEHP